METPQDLWDRANAVRARLNPAQRQEAERLAALWLDAKLHHDITPELLKAQDEALARIKPPPFNPPPGPEDAATQFKLGADFMDGPVRRDDFGIFWLQKAADQGFAKAQCTLGRAYAKGMGVRKDEVEAKAWLQKAADQNYAPAQYYLGSIDEPPTEASIAWLRKAAGQGYAKAQNLLALSLPEGHDKEAVEWLKKAVDQGDHDAMINLGHMYAEGWGIPKDSAKAADLIARGMIGTGEHRKDKAVACE
jgi:hypothetical protein